MTLQNKSSVEIRGIAQSYGIPDVFKKDKTHLIQEIELKQREMIPREVIEIPKPEYDGRLLLKPPSKSSNVDEIKNLLAEHVRKGLHLSFDETSWYMQFNKKNDQGTLRMPLRTVLHCANQVMK